MGETALIPVGIAVVGVIVSLIGVIYAFLNKGICKNEQDISYIKEKYQTKNDANRSEDKLTETIDRMERKIDTLISNMVGDRS